MLVSDGGLATELEARGHDLSDDLWSARLLVDAPEEIEAVHAAFFRAGAAVATTATYQASFDGFAARGIVRSRAESLMRLSVELARSARDNHGNGWVAASIGPYGAALANGEEYRGRYGLSVAELAAWHRPRLECSPTPEPTCWPSRLCPTPTKPKRWSLSSPISGCRRGCPTPSTAWLPAPASRWPTRSRSRPTCPMIVAVGVNCCAPHDVLPAITVAAEVTGKPIVVYPNSGEVWDGPRRVWTGSSRGHPN